MAALHYMLDYVLRTSPSDLERTNVIKDEGGLDHGFSPSRNVNNQPLKKQYKDLFHRSPEHLKSPQSPNLLLDDHGLMIYYKRTLENQREQIDSLERQLRHERTENKELKQLFASLHASQGGVPNIDEEYPYRKVNEPHKNRKRRALSPELSDDDDGDEDYLDDLSHGIPKRRRLNHSKDDIHERGVHDENGHHNVVVTPSKYINRNLSSPSIPLDTKFVLPDDIELDKRYFLKWNGNIYAVAKAFGDRNRLRKLVARYESEGELKASYLVDGEELRRLKSINPICHNTSYLGLYNLEFVRYFQRVTINA